MAGTATTNSYEVKFVPEATPEAGLVSSDIPELIAAALQAGFNIDISVQPGPVYSFLISKNGKNRVRVELGEVIVADNGVLYSMTPEDFATRYTPVP